MHKLTFVWLDDKYVRISKAKAKKLFKSGKEIAMVPSNLMVGNWVSPCVVQGSAFDEDAEAFEKIVNSFTYYNCVSRETGLYPSFFTIETVETVSI